jgi:hypothetical protein
MSDAISIKFSFTIPNEDELVNLRRWCWKNKITPKELDNLLDIITKTQIINE